MVSVLVLTAVTSTISSRAVSGSITTVKVSPAETVTPPRSAVPDTTVVDVADEVSAPGPGPLGRGPARHHLLQGMDQITGVLAGPDPHQGRQALPPQGIVLAQQQDSLQGQARGTGVRPQPRLQLLGEDGFAPTADGAIEAAQHLQPSGSEPAPIATAPPAIGRDG